MSDVQETTRLTAAAAAKAFGAGALLIDVSSEVGRGQDGELQGAVIIAKSDVPVILSRWPRRTGDDHKIIIFCGSVKGSKPVIDALLDSGFQNVFDVEGGFQSLRDQGLPLVAKTVTGA